MAEEERRGEYFLIDPLEIAKSELLAEKERLELIGFYHSHPDHEAVASKEDALHMIRGCSYVILSVKNGICRELRSYEKTDSMDIGAKEEMLERKG